MAPPSPWSIEVSEAALENNREAARFESRPTLRRLLGKRWTEQIESLEGCGAGVGREEVELEEATICMTTQKPRCDRVGVSRFMAVPSANTMLSHL